MNHSSETSGLVRQPSADAFKLVKTYVNVILLQAHGAVLEVTPLGRDHGALADGALRTHRAAENPFFPSIYGSGSAAFLQPNRQRRSVARFAQTGGRAVAVDLQPGNAQARNPVRFDRVLPGEEFFNR